VTDACLDAARAVEWDQARFAIEAEEHRRSIRMHTALCLAPSLEVFEALLQGETVPVDRLDQDELRRRGWPRWSVLVRLDDVQAIAGGSDRVSLDEIGGVG
jgi:hypothetical protein